MVECEICMDKFPIDCFEFFPCAHKLCKFCYHNIKQLKCPYCRLDLEPPSDIDDPDYEPDIPLEIPETPRNRRKNRRRNRRNSQRNSNNHLMFDDLTHFRNNNSNNNSNNSNNSNRNRLSNRNNNNTPTINNNSSNNLNNEENENEYSDQEIIITENNFTLLEN